MIRVENLTKSYGSRTILDDLTYHFPTGERVALVGPNGAGKTTLLNILCGLDDADHGKIVCPSGIKIGYLPQVPNQTPAPSVLEEAVLGGGGDLQGLYRRHAAALKRLSEDYTDANHAAYDRIDAEFRAAGGYALEANAKGILTGLGFQDETLRSSPLSLSGGWRMRLELAKVLLNNPDFLVLDEPTNHLDLPSLVWVERYLKTFAGTVVFVSHDRSLLERLPTTTLHLDRAKLTAYKGNLTAFLEERERRLEQEAAVAATLRKRREALEHFVERFGAKATKARQAQSKMKLISRLRDLEEGLDLGDKIESMHLRLPDPLPSGREVYTVKDGAIGYSRSLARGINLKIERGQKIAVIGANGIGKSTLLKTIASRIPPLSGAFTPGHNAALAYFAQDQIDTLDPEDSALANVLKSSARVSEKEARTLLGQFLFHGDDVFKPVRVLSGGEKSRVGLACLLVQRANLLLLDEPTNHLDISSAEILSQALEDYEGSVLFVSHDRAFIDSVCTHVFAMLGDGRSALFDGKLEDYQRMAARAGFPNVLDPEADEQRTEPAGAGKETPKPTFSSDGEVNELRKERQRLEKLIAKLDRDIAAMTKEIAAIDEDLVKSQGQFQKLSELAERQRLLREALEKGEEEWLSSSARIEEITAALKLMGRL